VPPGGAVRLAQGSYGCMRSRSVDISLSPRVVVVAIGSFTTSLPLELCAVGFMYAEDFIHRLRRRAPG